MYQQRIRELYDRLSPGYRRIARFALEHYQDAAFMTAAELARATDVDTTSVVRFAQRLGYAGFPEFINEVQDRVKRDLRQIYELDTGSEGSAEVFRQSLLEDRNSIDVLLRQPDLAGIGKVVDLICAAPRILVAGEAAANHVAEMLAGRLASLGLNAWNTGGDMLGRMSFSVQLEPGDVVIGLAPTNASAGIAVVLEITGEMGAYTVAIVGSETNRAALVAQYVLYAPANAAGLLYSLVPVTAAIHAISQAVALRRAEYTANLALRSEWLMRRYIEAMRAQAPVTVGEIIRAVNPGRRSDRPPQDKLPEMGEHPAPQDDDISASSAPPPARLAH